MNQSLVCERLNKRFGKTAALQDVSIRLEKNKIYGLLGRNGAGKTTLMHIAAGQLAPDEGRVAVFGSEPFENQSAQRLMCFVKDKHDFPKGFTVEQVLRLGSMFYPTWDAQMVFRLLDMFELDSRKKVKQLSRGMESALGIVIGLSSRAPLTIFDEPYLGLDAVARDRFYDVLLEDYQRLPRTIVFSTHLIDEVAKLFEHVLMIDKGRLLLDDDAEALRSRYCRVTGHFNDVDLFIKNKKVLHRQELGTTKSVAVEGPFAPEDIHAAESRGVELTGLSLQQLLVYLTTGEADLETGVKR